MEVRGRPGSGFAFGEGAVSYLRSSCSAIVLVLGEGWDNCLSDGSMERPRPAVTAAAACTLPKLRRRDEDAPLTQDSKAGIPWLLQLQCLLPAIASSA